jgi:hypothetical protein
MPKTYLQKSTVQVEFAHTDTEGSATFLSEDKTTILTIDRERWDDMGKPTELIVSIEPIRSTRTEDTE